VNFVRRNRRNTIIKKGLVKVWFSGAFLPFSLLTDHAEYQRTTEKKSRLPFPVNGQGFFISLFHGTSRWLG
jgi:hypothetical protein